MSAAVARTGTPAIAALSALPLLELMPPLLHVRMDEARTQAMQATLQLLAMEADTPGPGSGLVVSRLADIIVVQALRAHAVAAGDAGAGWLSAQSDRGLGPGLRAIHRNLGPAGPSQKWWAWPACRDWALPPGSSAGSVKRRCMT
jgi:hypothetical protein